ncbi:MAG: 50S ribosomal protein L15 [Candidatus Liptonbacteria bacterium]|nr:50S ribosomal protein L15 [Candidatus Liptonbacteria bacterium]
MLYNLKPQHSRKNKKRVGRGGKRGTTSGKGQKGQKSRSGHKLRPAFRDLLIRIPKLRGFKNKPTSVSPKVLNLSDLEKINSSVISVSTLKKEGALNKNYRGQVKILGDGKIKRPLAIRGLLVSKSAKDKILKAGGKIVI